ncbi:collagen-like protein [Maribacter sp. LLG6340-A2]|uniref:collagen-like triple helix repeat-containing protein n=1 Tax=Maribacter sp. LLG6340-A2 TaxID=3160834 RepID=UPI0038651359
MKTPKTYILTVFTFIMVTFGFAQVKIGDNIDAIESTSILELESTNKVLVLTRLTNEQMMSITPLPGGMAYNIDTGCIHSYNGTNWVNLCNSDSRTFSFIDNEDGSFTINYGDENVFTSPNLTGPKGEKGDTGPEGPPGEDGLSQQEQIVIVASNGQTRFNTPAPIVDDKKISVYRNGIRIAFKTIDSTTIELENEIICYQNDNIRIVQIL